MWVRKGAISRTMCRPLLGIPVFSRVSTGLSLDNVQVSRRTSHVVQLHTYMKLAYDSWRTHIFWKDGLNSRSSLKICAVVKENQLPKNQEVLNPSFDRTINDTFQPPSSLTTLAKNWVVLEVLGKQYKLIKCLVKIRDSTSRGSVRTFAYRKPSRLAVRKYHCPVLSHCFLINRRNDKLKKRETPFRVRSQHYSKFITHVSARNERRPHDLSVGDTAWWNHWLTIREKSWITLNISGPGSSVVIATELRAGRSGIEFRWGRDFPTIQTGTGAHPASCTMGTGSFPGVKCGRDVGLTPTPSSAEVLERVELYHYSP